MEGGDTIKKVLWISRHEMTPEQKADLERLMGGEVELIRHWETVAELSALEPEIREADAVAAVLPAEKLAELLHIAKGKPVLQACSVRQPTGGFRKTPEGTVEPEFAFVHRCWQQVIRLEIETKDL